MSLFHFENKLDLGDVIYFFSLENQRLEGEIIEFRGDYILVESKQNQHMLKFDEKLNRFNEIERL